MDYFNRLKVTGWVDAYYQPEKMKQRELNDPGFRERYIDSCIQDIKIRGKAAISKFDSITGNQVYYTEDPCKIL